MNQQVYDRAISQLLGSSHYRTETSSCEFRVVPQDFLDRVELFDAAISRKITGYSPHPDDDVVITARVDALVEHIHKHREPDNGSFQDGYAELLLKVYPGLQQASAELIEKEWEADEKISHYPLFSALIMNYPEKNVMLPTLQEIRILLRSWNNEGWCPWTPALWMRMLWLGNDLQDASVDITTQMAYIDIHLDQKGRFQYRDPFCLMYAIALMNHPIGAQMMNRFLNAIIAEQRDDGGWGDDSYIVFMVLQKWGVWQTVVG